MEKKSVHFLQLVFRKHSVSPSLCESMDRGTRRVTKTRLIDDGCRLISGDFLLHEDGSFSASKGHEDVIEEISGQDRIITRSFQNWHTHSAMVLNKSFGEGLPLMEWLETAIFPVEKGLTPEFVRIGTLAAAAEMISTGTTFACDMYYFPEIVANSFSESGIRAKVCGAVSDKDEIKDSKIALKDIEKLLSSGHNEADRIEYGIGPHSVYTCEEETLKQSSELSKKYGCSLSIHASETRKEVTDCYGIHGMYPIEYLESIDFLSECTICAHCGWVTKKEMRILARHGTHAVHCPTSNQKLACGGTLSYPAMKDAEVSVFLGTDGAASNNSLDMRSEAKTASLIQKHDHWDASILNPEETWKLATNKSKDWISWDLEDIRLRPWGESDSRLLSNLLYSGGNILDVFVNGEAVRRNGVTLTINEKEIAKELENSVKDYYDS